MIKPLIPLGGHLRYPAKCMTKNVEIRESLGPLEGQFLANSKIFTV